MKESLSKVRHSLFYKKIESLKSRLISVCFIIIKLSTFCLSEKVNKVNKKHAQYLTEFILYTFEYRICINF